MFQRLCKIWDFLRKSAQFTTVLPFLSNFFLNVGFLAHFVCAKQSNRNIGRAKKNVFRKSASLLDGTETTCLVINRAPLLAHNMIIALFDNNNKHLSATVKVSRIFDWDFAF